MRKIFLLLFALAFVVTACKNTTAEEGGNESSPSTEEFSYVAEQFADLRILRYRIPDFDRLSLDQKKLVYYLTQAGLSGRDITWDQNYRHNLVIRKALEQIVNNYEGDRESEDWGNFMVYAKRVWFSNGIHHHYSKNKFNPDFSREYFESLLADSGASLDSEVLDVLFNPELDAKMVNLDPEKGLLTGSATNYYDPDITQAEVEAYYEKVMDKDNPEPISYGLNSKIIRNDAGELEEVVWNSEGLYGPAIKEVMGWLEKAAGVAENEPQKKALELLIEYYRTGSLKTWDDYNIAWVGATDGDIDYINGFIEVYDDPLGYRGYYESIIEINDFQASERMATLAADVQWFEDNSSIMPEHKKEDVVGVSYKVVNVAGEAGASSPSTPIGVNLPNANWIRAKHGSKSVSLGNIVDAYNNAGSSQLYKEFFASDEIIERIKEHGNLGSKLHTALHEVIGHASGKLEPGVGTPKETLKNYSSALEEGRADLVSLYFIMDPKLIELGVMPSLDVGKAEYDSYITNGLMMQLRRLEEGEVIEESHMRNRQMVAAWAYEKGKEENVIERIEKEGKTFFVINDYERLRELFGDLLREVQRVKSQGDYEAGKNLIENYGVQVDADLHKEVLQRAESLGSAPYSGFINPELVPVLGEDGEITDVKVEYPSDFTQQMLKYGEKYSFL